MTRGHIAVGLAALVVVCVFASWSGASRTASASLPGDDSVMRVHSIHVQLTDPNSEVRFCPEEGPQAFILTDVVIIEGEPRRTLALEQDGKILVTLAAFEYQQSLSFRAGIVISGKSPVRVKYDGESHPRVTFCGFLR